MVGFALILLLSFASEPSRADEECVYTLAELSSQLQEIEQSAGTPGNAKKLDGFTQNLAICPSLSIELAPLEQILKIRKINSIAETRFQIEKILQIPNKNGNIKIDELRKLGLKAGMKQKEFDEARVRWREALNTAEKKFSELTTARCDPKNQAKKFPPTHNQGMLGWCYAYVAADLLAFETGKSVAPLSIGLGYFQKNNYADFLTSDRSAKAKILRATGGHITDAIKIAQTEGVCPARQDVAPDDLFHRVLTLLDQTRIPTFLSSDDNFCDAYASATLTLFPNVSAKEFERILRKAGVKDILAEMREASCKKKLRLPKNLEVDNVFYPNDKNTRNLEEIQKALLRNSVAGVSVNMGQILNEKSDHDRHAMIVIGQELNSESGQCEFILRNSWGANCENVNEQKASCDPKTGNLKLTADILAEITYGTTTLSKVGK